MGRPSRIAFTVAGIRWNAMPSGGRRGPSLALRFWLQEGHDGVDRVEALGLDFLGFSTWARSEAEVVR